MIKNACRVKFLMCFDMSIASTCHDILFRHGLLDDTIIKSPYLTCYDTIFDMPLFIVWYMKKKCFLRYGVNEKCTYQIFHQGFRLNYRSLAMHIIPSIISYLRRIR